MFAIHQIVENPQDMIAIAEESRHRRNEIIFIALDQKATATPASGPKPSLAPLAGCWEGETLQRTPQGGYENRRELE